LKKLILLSDTYMTSSVAQIVHKTDVTTPDEKIVFWKMVDNEDPHIYLIELEHTVNEMKIQVNTYLTQLLDGTMPNANELSVQLKDDENL
jgi:hypothetical protein